MLSKNKSDDAGTCGGDFLVAYSAGTLAREGHFADLHDRHQFMERIKQVGGTTGIHVGASVGPWMNPPFFLWPFMGLDALPYRAALWTWWAISGICLAWAARFIGSMLRPAVRLPVQCAMQPTSDRFDWRSTALVPALLLLSMPAFQTFTHGQSSAISLLLLALSVSFWRRGRGLEAGLAIGFLFYKPQLALLVAAVLVIDQGRRALVGLTITGVVLLAGMLLTMPHELSLYLRHAAGVSATMQSDGVFPWHRHATLAAFWRLLLQGDRSGPSTLPVRIITIASSIVALLALAIGLLKYRRPGVLSEMRSPGRMALRRDRLITASVVATPLIMPYYVDYDLLLLAIPATLFAGELLRRGNRAAGDGKLAACWAVVYVWLYLNPGIAAMTGMNITVALLAMLLTASIARLLRTTEPFASAGAPLFPIPPTPAFAA